MMQTSVPRKPRVFSPDDPALSHPQPEPAPEPVEAAPPSAGVHSRSPTEGRMMLSRIRWGTLLVSSLASLLMLASGLWFASFVSIALERQDAIGWIALALLAIAALAALIIAARELLGLMRLARLGELRKEIDAALRDKALHSERRAVRRLKSLFAARPELRWQIGRLSQHEADVRDPGELLRLAERELIAPLDSEARRLVMASAKRVSIVTALSPAAVLAVLFVLFENVRMLRALAGLYGGRPGTLGGLKLARMVAGHIIATSGIAFTDDLLGQFLGHDALRRLSRRLGEGAFNGALTARVGTAAIQVCRPMPVLEAPPVRLRDLLPELLRRAKVANQGKAKS